MTVFLPILVCLCGGVGASCRYLLDVTIKTYWQRAFPLSTFTINPVSYTHLDVYKRQVPCWSGWSASG